MFFIILFCIYKNGKKLLSKTQRKAPKRYERYQNLSEEEKDRRWKKTWERY